MIMTRLAIVGASVRAAAQSARRAGFDVVGADLFADADLDGICPITRIENYPDGLADWLAAQDIDAWMYTGALENYPELVDRMARIAPLWGVSGDALRHCRDPIRLMRDCYDSDLGFPGTYRARPRSKDPVSYALNRFAKTYRHSNGQGVWRIQAEADWLRAIEEDAYIQIDVLSGDPNAAVFAVGGQSSVCLGMTKQVIGSEWGYRGSIGPVQPNAKQAETLRRIGVMLRDKLELRGLIGVDLVQSDECLAVIEINPRYTASVEVLERATGRSAISAHAAACRGEAVEPWGSPDSLVGKRIVFASEPMTITPELDAWMSDEQQAGRLADRPRLGESIDAGRPVCTLLAVGYDSEAIEKNLRTSGAILARAAS